MREKNLIPAEVLSEAGAADAAELMDLGISAAKAERFERGLILLTEAYNRFAAKAEAEAPVTPPMLSSYLGLCLAQTRGRYRDAARFCEMAIHRDPFTADHYVNLARVWQAGRSPKNVVEAIERGLRVVRAPALLVLQKQLGARRTPIVKFLPRGNPVNVTLGKIRQRLENKRRQRSGGPAPRPRTPQEILDLDAESGPPRTRPRPGGPTRSGRGR